MKIYRKLVLDLLTGQTLYEDSYEYNGPVAECKNEASHTLTSQNSTAFGNLSNASNMYNQFYSTLNNYMADRFGRQSKTFNTLSGRLNKATRIGTGSQYLLHPRIPGSGATGGGGGLRREGGAGGREGTGEGGGPNSLLEKNNLLQYGYDPSLFQTDYDPQSFYGSEEAALRSQSSEEVAKRYEDAQMALGQRSQQLGGFAPGLEAAGLSELLSGQASEEASGQRQVSMQGAENLRQEMAHLADLKAQLALGQAQGMSAAAQLRLQDVIARRQEALQKSAMNAARAGAAAANAERAKEFAWSQKMDVANLRSNDFYRGIGALSGVAGMQNPVDYGQLGLGALGGSAGIWGNAFNQTNQYLTQKALQPSFWGKLATAAVGGLAGGLTGNIGGMFGGATSGWNVPTASTPWSLSSMAPG